MPAPSAGRSISILPERKILLNHDGTVDRVVVPERLEAHRLIEEFMILANVAAAETLEKARVPLIYRVHDEPSMEKLARAARIPRHARHALRQGRRGARVELQRILDRVKGRDTEQLVNEVVLRTQAQAEYAAENYGHFGLNLRRYAHFTSPIRRYADLIVHRGADPRPQARRRRPARRTPTSRRLPRSPPKSRRPSAAPCWPSAKPMTG